MTTTDLARAFAFATVLALGACGGGGKDDTDDTDTDMTDTGSTDTGETEDTGDSAVDSAM